MAVVVAGTIQGKAGKPGKAGKAGKTGPGQTKPRLGTTGKPAKPKQAALGFLEGKSKLGFESWGAAFGKHLPRNPTFGISKLGDYGVVSIFKKFTKIGIFCIFGVQNGGFGVQNGGSKLGF